MKKYIGLLVVLLIIVFSVGDSIGQMSQKAPQFVHLFYRDSTGEVVTMHDTLLMNKWINKLLTVYSGSFTVDTLLTADIDTMLFLSPVDFDSSFALRGVTFEDTVAIIITDSLVYYLTKATFGDSVAAIDSTYITNDKLGFEDINRLPEEFALKLYRADVRDSINAVVSDSSLINQTELTVQLADSVTTFTKLSAVRDSINAVLSDSSLINQTELTAQLADTAATFLKLSAYGDSVAAHLMDSVSAIDSTDITNDKLGFEDINRLPEEFALKLYRADVRDSINAVVSDSSLINQTELTAQLADSAATKATFADVSDTLNTIFPFDTTQLNDTQWNVYISAHDDNDSTWISITADSAFFDTTRTEYLNVTGKYISIEESDIKDWSTIWRVVQVGDYGNLTSASSSGSGMYIVHNAIHRSPEGWEKITGDESSSIWLGNGSISFYVNGSTNSGLFSPGIAVDITGDSLVTFYGDVDIRGLADIDSVDISGILRVDTSAGGVSGIYFDKSGWTTINRVTDDNGGAFSFNVMNKDRDGFITPLHVLPDSSVKIDYHLRLNPFIAPVGPEEGDFYYDAVTDRLIYRNASAWKTLATTVEDSLTLTGDPKPYIRVPVTAWSGMPTDTGFVSHDTLSITFDIDTVNHGGNTVTNILHIEMPDTGSVPADSAWIVTWDIDIPPYYVGLDSIVIPYKTAFGGTDSNGVDFYVDETSLTAYPAIVATDIGNSSTTWAYAVFSTADLAALTRYDHFRIRARVWSHSVTRWLRIGEPIIYWKVGS